MTELTGHYTVLARRFRPQTFDEVVGQERIGQALRNAIRADRVAHAYLFTGARGVGKTSTARIFAKALNCPHVREAVPCNECDVCRAIAAGSDVDVLEIDGASNRRIDDIRSLRSNVSVKAMRSPYKVYIIDEVHMLTKEAFNALLKTLEEPPPNVKFVFCTTDPGMVPDTILSRCQRFDFGTIAAASIRDRLGQIAAAEGVAVEDEALELVARRAAGSMRDSQSLFDQLLAFGGDSITANDVHQLLGTASDERLIAMMEAIIERQRDKALEMLDRALNEGVQIGSLSDQLLHYLRDLLIVAAGAEGVDLQSVASAHRPRLAEQATKWGLGTITAAMQVLTETKARMQRVNYDRALMELAVIRLSLLDELDDIAALVESVRGGSDGSAAGSAAPRRPSRAASPVGTKTSQPRPEARGTSRRPEPSGTASGNPLGEEPVAARKSVEFTAARTSEFVTELYNRLGDRISEQLKKADAIAISGPNHLEISFPQSYFLSRQYVERPEVLGQIREAAADIAGRAIDVSIRTTPASLPSDKTTPETRNANGRRRRPPKLEGDRFVEQAASLFGGTIIDVREIPESSEQE